MADSEPIREQTLQGDRAAFDRLIAPLQKPLTRFCGKFLPQPEDAADAVQETLLRAWKFRQTFRQDSSFATWLYRIARNACLDLLEDRKRIPRARLEESLPDAAPREIPSPEPTAEQLIVWRQMRETVLTQGRTAKPPWDDVDWIVYRWHCEKEESFREIADRLKMDESTVKQRYYRKIAPVIARVAAEFADERA